MGQDDRNRPNQPLPLGGRVAAKRPGGVERSRELRRNMTDAEWKMWHIIRDIDWPQAHFRRQVKIGPFYADFLSHAYKLIIEVDGATHSTCAELEHDHKRTAFLNQQGYRVFRISNDEALNGMDEVLTLIRQALEPST